VSWRDRAFLADVAAINLQRLFWLLVVGLGSRLLEFAFQRESAVHSDLLALLTRFDLLAIPLVIIVTWRLRRPGASLTNQWALTIFIVLGTIGMMIVYTLGTAAEVGYRATYVYGVMIMGVAYLVPPRVMVPIYAVMHAGYCGLVVTGGFDDRFRLAALMDGTLGVLFASGVSWLLYRSKEKDFLKERTIALQNRALARHNQEMQDLMAVAAHDLRSPLQGLDNVLELAGGLVDPAAARLRQALGEGRDSCQRMLSLVTRLLDAHAAEHRRGRAGDVRCDAVAAFAEAARRHESAAVGRGVRLRSVLPEGTAEVPMDAEALGQVLDNLIGNALKFAPAGSVVELALAGDAAAGWTGEVRDEGPGVPADEQAGLFGKFRRGANSPASGEAGFGLGLFIVRQLLVSAGGDVVYVERKPRGAVFRMALPRVG
jgi:signal transduction histidine kinase